MKSSKGRISKTENFESQRAEKRTVTLLPGKKANWGKKGKQMEKTEPQKKKKTGFQTFTSTQVSEHARATNEGERHVTGED